MNCAPAEGPRTASYTLRDLECIARDLGAAIPNGRVAVLFSDARVSFRARPSQDSMAVDEFVWCYGALAIKKGRDDLYTFDGIVAGKDAFSYTTQIRTWRAMRSSAHPGADDPVLVGFRATGEGSPERDLGDVIIAPSYRR